MRRLRRNVRLRCHCASMREHTRADGVAKQFPRLVLLAAATTGRCVDVTAQDARDSSTLRLLMQMDRVVVSFEVAAARGGPSRQPRTEVRARPRLRRHARRHLKDRVDGHPRTGRSGASPSR